MKTRAAAAVLVAAALALAAGRFLASDGAAGAAFAQEKDPARINFHTYRLRVGDQINITVYSKGDMKPDTDRSIEIPATGEVSFTPVGKLTLVDRTTTEVEEAVRERLKSDGWLKEPVVGCYVLRYSPRYVAIVGAVQTSVELPTQKDLRILELLARAGGIGDKRIDYSRVVVRRAGQDGKPFNVEINVDDILERNQEEKNIVVREGDLVRLYELESAESPQSAEFVYITGKIRSPGRHPIIHGRTPFTITKLVAICGDFAEFANQAKIRIIRTTETGRTFKEIDFEDIIENKAPDFELKGDDFVYVPERLF